MDADVQTAIIIYNDRINTWRKYGLDFDTDYEKVVNAQTTESISAFVAELLKAGNAAEVIMMPAE